MTVTITWTPPTQDVSGNSLDLSDVTYAVLRSTDGRDYELLQQGITETKYVDNSIKEATGQSATKTNIKPAHLMIFPIFPRKTALWHSKCGIHTNWIWN